MASLLGLLARREQFGSSHRALVDFQYEKKLVHYSKELKAHFGCVNALGFSPNGQFMASGGDDRRVLIWNVAKALSSSKFSVRALKGRHESNVFCVDFDHDQVHIFSGGNDEKVLVHDLATGETKDVFPHDFPIYCLSSHPHCKDIFLSASSDGRVLEFDLRASNSDPNVIQSSRHPFHGVHFNPFDPRLIVTANQEDGAILIDRRYANKPVMKYRKPNYKNTAMCARFSPQDGSRILVLGRRQNPLLYDISQSSPIVEFDHPGYFNSVTMKSATFGHDFVLCGSDDFNVYGWKIPVLAKDSFQHIRRADFVLKGHRSIVNQVKFNPTFNLAATSGVEKKIIWWSPLNISSDEQNSKFKMAANSRRITRPENPFTILQETSDLIFDGEQSTVEENPKMLAFFDTLVQRDLCSESSEDTLSLDSSDSDNSSADDHDETVEEQIAKKRQNIRKRQMRKAQRQNRQNEEVITPAALRQAPQLDLNMHNEILDALASETRSSSSSDTDDTVSNSPNERQRDTSNSSSDDEDNNNFRVVIKKAGTKGRCYRSRRN